MCGIGRERRSSRPSPDASGYLAFDLWGSSCGYCEGSLGLSAPIGPDALCVKHY